jgi:hypothetical protein
MPARPGARAVGLRESRPTGRILEGGHAAQATGMPRTRTRDGIGCTFRTALSDLQPESLAAQSTPSQS